MTFSKRLNTFEVATLLLTVCAAPWVKATAQVLPPPGTYELDPPHTFAYFNARHLVVGLVRGRFDKIAGTITVAKDPAACSLNVTIDATSISTQNSVRDDDLRGPAFFDVKNFPTMTYAGHGCRRSSGNSWTMDGSLTIRGVTKVVPLRFTFNGTAPSQAGKPARVAFHGSAGAKRADFGMTRDNLIELGPFPAPGPDVLLEIDAEALANLPTHGTLNPVAKPNHTAIVAARITRRLLQRYGE
jgi:polyisoprenoid-binding protein YceI